MTNDIFGAFIAGFALCLILLAIFQVGLNIGIRIISELLEHEYPAAFKFLEKNKKVARLYPYVIGGNNE